MNEAVSIFATIDANVNQLNIMNEHSHKLIHAYESVAVATPYIWGSCGDFRGLCDVMVLYLNRTLSSAPSHIGPLWDETGIISNQCKTMCRNGMLTISSQPSYIDGNDNDGWDKRANLEIVIEGKNNDIFIQGMKRYPELVLESVDIQDFQRIFEPFVISKKSIIAVFSYFIRGSNNKMFDDIAAISRTFN